VEGTYNPEGGKEILRVRELLLHVYPELFEDRYTFNGAYRQGSAVLLGKSRGDRLRKTPRQILSGPSAFSLGPATSYVP
jgi:hypothetical protein